MSDDPWGKNRKEGESPWKKEPDKGKPDMEGKERNPWGKEDAEAADAPNPWGKEKKVSEPAEEPKPRLEDRPTSGPEKEEPPEEEILVPVEEETANLEKEWSGRRRNRSAAIQFLYAWALNKPDDLPDFIDEFFIERELNREEYVYAEELIHGAVGKMDEIDEVIRETAENWGFDRIAKIDLTLLRLGIHELLHRPDVPPVVVINEIIDLGKAYSEEKSKRFLNGILDRVLAKLDRPARESSS